MHIIYYTDGEYMHTYPCKKMTQGMHTCLPQNNAQSFHVESISVRLLCIVPIRAELLHYNIRNQS